MDVDNYIQNCKIHVRKEKFAILKSKEIFPEAFASIKDKSEFTAIIDQSKINNNKDITNIKKDFKLITFDTILPFDLVGFLAKISGALADEKISIFVISSFSTDHILVEEKYLDKAVKKLEETGLKLATG
jgi:uncharacterized protein